MSYDLLDAHQLGQQHRRVVAKISFLVAVASCLILVSALFLISDDSGQSYSSIISSHALTGRQLAPALTIAGLVLVALAGFITWLVTLSGSFQIAGPLFRLAQNMKLASQSSSSMVLPIRQSDAIHQQAGEVNKAIVGIHEHYAAVRAAAREASEALTAGDAERYEDAVIKLRSLDEKSRF